MIVCPRCGLAMSNPGNQTRHESVCGIETPAAFRKRQQRERERAAVQLPPPDWRERAACRNKPTDWWFPSAEQSTRNSVLTAANKEALRICNETCTVRGSCLEFAMQVGPSLSGIFGGLTEGQRRGRRGGMAS